MESRWLRFIGGKKKEFSALGLPVVRLFSAEARVSVLSIMDCRIMTPPRVGMPYDCVLDFKAHLEDRMVLVFDVARQQECLLTCYGWEGGRKSFYHLMTVEQDPLILTCNEKTVVIETPCRNQPPKCIVELGACTGAMSVGPQFLGATTLASLDSNRLACDHLSHNSHGVVHHVTSLTQTLFVISIPACLGFLVNLTPLRGSCCIKLIHDQRLFGQGFVPSFSCKHRLVFWSVSQVPRLIPISSRVWLLWHRS